MVSGEKNSRPVVEVCNLRKEFVVSKQESRVAVAGIDFTIQPGEFVGYAGPNGAGKSTTVKILTGILRPTVGKVIVAGLQPWQDYPFRLSDWRSRWIQWRCGRGVRQELARRTGVVFGQRSSLWWELPLRESFDLVRDLYQVPAEVARRRLAALNEALNLGPLLNQKVSTLSLGQRMRAEIAAAVLPRPAVLFLDEPTIGLDVEAKATVRQVLRELNAREGTTILLTTHDLDDITALCRRLMVIDRGRLIYDGTVEGLRNTYSTERVLVVDLLDPPGDFRVSGATVIRAEGARRWLSFPRDASAAALVERVLAAYQVADLTLEEPQLEDVIRRMYRGELTGLGEKSAGPAR